MIKESESQVVLLKVYTVKEMALMYGVSSPTFKKWLKPHDEKIGKKVGWYYSVLQVKAIFESLGFPNRPIDNKSVNVD
jgi:uncharacterized protein YjcR